MEEKGNFKQIFVGLALAFGLLSAVLIFFISMLAVVFSVLSLILIVVGFIVFRKQPRPLSVMIMTLIIAIGTLSFGIVKTLSPATQKTNEEILSEEDFTQEINESDKEANAVLEDLVQDTIENKVELSDEEKARKLQDAADKALEDAFKELENDN